MTQAAENAAVMPPSDATWDWEFMSLFMREGLEAALVHLSERHDLEVEEAVAVTATIMGLIAVEQA